MSTEPEAPGRRRVVLGPAAHVLRRRVGATAWMVLEEMLEQSDVDDDSLVAAVSVRSLSASIGIAKDTVHRALTRLRDLGVIEAHQARTAAGGFAAGGYRLCVPAACLSIVRAASPSAPASAPEASCRRAPSGSRASDQLELVFES